MMPLLPEGWHGVALFVPPAIDGPASSWTLCPEHGAKFLDLMANQGERPLASPVQCVCGFGAPGGPTDHTAACTVRPTRLRPEKEET
jgi:hypothetical protein